MYRQIFPVVVVVISWKLTFIRESNQKASLLRRGSFSGETAKKRGNKENRKKRQNWKLGCAEVDGKTLEFSFLSILSPGSTSLNFLSPGSSRLNSLSPGSTRLNFLSPGSTRLNSFSSGSTRLNSLSRLCSLYFDYQRSLFGGERLERAYKIWLTCKVWRKKNWMETDLKRCMQMLKH